MQSYHVSIDIMLRESILDVQGKTVEKSLHSIGFQDINGVRIGKRVELSVEAESEEAARARVQDACEKLIANPIMEDYAIAVVRRAGHDSVEAA